MRIDYIINELIKKVEMTSIHIDTIDLKKLDKRRINRL